MARLDATGARERFAAARVARLATISPDGAPRIVPIVFALDGDTIYMTVDAKPKRTTELARLANVAAEPRVSVLVDHYDEDWDALWWARADGRGRVLQPGEDEARRAVARLAARYPQQRGAGAVLAIDVARWTGWAARPGEDA